MTRIKRLLACVLLIMIGFIAGYSRPRARRIGMVIGIRPEKMIQYKSLHADSNPGVRDLLKRYHLTNFSIYSHRLDDGKNYLFGYYEYDGTTYELDMTRLAAEPRNKEWLTMTDPMQIPLKNEKSWAVMEEVYHND
jgi:L-rhamnose mutarotase